MWTRTYICHWCHKGWKAKIGDTKRYFCSNAHKQAHHRAYKKYVTQTTQRMPTAGSRRVTHKKRK